MTGTVNNRKKSFLKLASNLTEELNQSQDPKNP